MGIPLVRDRTERERDFFDLLVSLRSSSFFEQFASSSDARDVVSLGAPSSGPKNTENQFNQPDLSGCASWFFTSTCLCLRTPKGPKSGCESHVTTVTSVACHKTPPPRLMMGHHHRRRLSPKAPHLGFCFAALHATRARVQCQVWLRRGE